MTPVWSGVFSALTTKMFPSGSIDFASMENHINIQVESGVNGLVVLGSLGENVAFDPDEKVEIVKHAVAATCGRVPVLSGVAECSTAHTREFILRTQSLGLSGFMVMPPMVYAADRRETLDYFRTIGGISTLPIMLYNNPVSYKVDLTPDMLAELADEPTFVAIKESSDDVRRITDIIDEVGDRYTLFTGVDDLAMESLMLGCSGWVAGLVCAFPKETVALYSLVKAQRYDEARELYRWFMPLLHLDVSTKFVQNIKLAEAMVGTGTEHVRLPRLPLAGEERIHVESIVVKALATRPALPSI